MALIKWAPFEDVDRIFDHFGDLSRQRYSFDLAADVYEDKGNVVVEMHIPGVDSKKLDIEVDGELLKVSGSREDKSEKKDKNFFSREINYGSFERTIVLPKKVLSDKAKASYQDGTLKVEMPIESVAKTKKISVG